MVVQIRNQNSILNLFYQLPRNFVTVFQDYWWWHLGAIILTYLLVMSGFDWFYFTFFRNTVFYPASFSAAIIGGLAPIFVPLIIYIIGLVYKNSLTVNLAAALGQATLLGSVISSLYKALTGRIYPPYGLATTATDITHVFKFGVLRGGIFWGWPSSHTTIAFALSVTLLMLYPKNKIVKFAAILYALYIGLSVAISIHWFSDFAAGAIIGTAIGLVVGKSFYARSLSLRKV